MIKEAEFVKRCTDQREMGYPDKPEYAFIGRSNVGKSSLINMLTGRKNLAHTSANPGKTRTIDLFLINKKWNLVDLPGYGYAKTSKKDREDWLAMMENYFMNRANLVNVFLLIYASISPKDSDIRFCNWLGMHGIPFSLVFTKTDKEKTASIEANIAEFKAQLAEDWEEFPPEFKTSVKAKSGAKAVLDYINSINEAIATQ